MSAMRRVSRLEVTPGTIGIWIQKEAAMRQRIRQRGGTWSRERTAPDRNLKPALRSRSLAWKKSRRAASPDSTMTGVWQTTHEISRAYSEAEPNGIGDDPTRWR